MPYSITDGIKVSVETAYEEHFSKPLQKTFFHVYKITIVNLGMDTVQLLRRHWCIWDSAIGLREVKGAGVVGEQPILEPGEQHEYYSNCPLCSEIGQMYGTFTMQRMEDKSRFKAFIPRFVLVAPCKLN